MRYLLCLLFLAGGSLAGVISAEAAGLKGSCGKGETCLIENCPGCKSCNSGRSGDGLLGGLCKKNKGCGAGIEGLDPWFNCGCNGSYKFPVPPLYTYHWPGMYSHQLMTDYHSPWRFPPLKPYVDEVEVIDNLQQQGTTVPAPSLIRPTSATRVIQAPQVESRLDRIDPIGARFRTVYGQ